MLRRPLLAVLALLTAVTPTLVACPDWNAFGAGNGPGDDDDDDDDTGDEGEGDGANEGEGEASEGEGDSEGEGPSGPLWEVVDAPVSAQAELAQQNGYETLSSFDGRLFAVGVEHIFELLPSDDGDALETIATLQVPCNDAQLTGPVAVDGADLLVATISGAVRFHDNGSCDPEYVVNGTGSPSTVVPLAGSALVYDGQTLTLVDGNGDAVDTHAFEDFTEGDFYAVSADEVLLVRRYNTSPGQVVRVTLQASELIIAPVADLAMMLADDLPVSVSVSNRFDARFLDVTIDPAAETPVTAELRVAPEDTIASFASDPSGKIAAVGSSALVAVADVSAADLAVTSITGQRYGAVDRFAVSPSGELWGVGFNTLLYWTASAAASRSAPTIVDVDITVSSLGPLRAIDGKLFFSSGDARQLQRADVDLANHRLQIVDVVDSVSFSPIPVDFSSRFAFVPAEAADDGAPDRLVEATRDFVRVFELGDDLGAVTAVLVTDVSSAFFTSPGAIAILDDGTKAAYLVQSTLYVCPIELAAGVAPVVTCDGGRSAGIFGNSGRITIVDPSAGVDDETFVVSVSGGVGIVEPGEQGRVISIATDGNAPALLIQGCVVGFSANAQSWTAFNPDQPEAPAERRGFGALDAVVLGDSVLVAGPSDGGAGQLAYFPKPIGSNCKDTGGDPVLDGTALMGGDVRTQRNLTEAAWVSGELYVIDEDGLVWHVPTP